MSVRSQVYSSCLVRHRSTSAAGLAVISAAARPTEATSSSVPYRSKARASIPSIPATLGSPGPTAATGAGRPAPMIPGVPDDPVPAPARGRQLTYLGLAGSLTIPGVAFSRLHPDIHDALLALVFGIAVIGAAFLLSWAAEAAQLDISAGLAIAVLALIAIFAAYMVRISKAPAEEPDLVGPAALIGTFTTAGRRAAVVALFVVSALVILACAEPFAESLVDTGRRFGINEFLLVQWLAPLASEAPELLVAGLYAYRLNTNAGLGTLVSSKVNQWTLLIGTMPIAFALASGSLHGLPIIARQREELLLTAAQSIFAVATLCSLSLSVREAAFLFGLFWAQFLTGAFAPDHLHGLQLLFFSGVYLVLAARIVFSDRRALPTLVKDGFRTPYAQLADDG